eukprot:354941-Chlamydomonas_euryale.AAC.3
MSMWSRDCLPAVVARTVRVQESWLMSGSAVRVIVGLLHTLEVARPGMLVKRAGFEACVIKQPLKQSLKPQVRYRLPLRICYAAGMMT